MLTAGGWWPAALSRPDARTVRQDGVLGNDDNPVPHRPGGAVDLRALREGLDPHVSTDARVLVQNGPPDRRPGPDSDRRRSRIPRRGFRLVVVGAHHDRVLDVHAI